MGRDMNQPVSLKQVKMRDEFWKREMELVRREVIPYQWRALNDEVEGASPSYSMRNFRTAGKLNKMKREQGDKFREITWSLDTFETLPEDKDHPEDRFYGFLFQDSDFYKWIEAVGYSLSVHPDPELEEIADKAIQVVSEAQLENGYLDTYYIINDQSKIFSNLKDNHELYCFGHLAEGAVAYYQATGKDELLTVAEKFAGYIASYFGEEEGKCKGYPGHEVAEMALVRLYEVTGKESYLELSRFFVDQRGTQPYYYDKEHPEAVKKGKEDELRYHYHQAHLPVREQTEAHGHSVRAVYLYSGMADLARITGDKELLKACETLWDDMVNRKMYITGGIGATHLGEAFSFPYDLPNDTAYAETCASIGLMFFARRMLQISPDSKYSDVMERALYNGVLSGMALDGKSFFYVNPLEVLPEACHKDERKFHVKPVRQKWFGCACCPPNIARLLSSIASYAYTETEDTLYVHMYMGSIVEKDVKGKKAGVEITSEFPWDGKVTATVRLEGEEACREEFTLAFRIPGWCQGYTLNGGAGLQEGEERKEGTKTYRVKDGYLYVRGNWSDGEKTELTFPMEILMMQSNPSVRENIGKACLMRGPLVYCLEEADNGKELHRYYLTEELKGKTEVTDELGQPMTALFVEGKCREQDWKDDVLYREYRRPEWNDCSLKFIPYFAWANRGEGEMKVWVPVTAD